ncbi:caspase family protein [Lewinella cohaerens]|uniref:caspase family protein n=1 Tax=Lewinella cohaerens TaxID=70995 RepID=UPI00037FE165|nr:caspase family protein [Lewinella cohaerens]
MAKSLIIVILSVITGFSLSAQVGCSKGNCLNGYGNYTFPGGARYMGDFKDGKMHGEGILYYVDGSKYIGNWHEQEREGKGRMTFANGDVYFGIFKAGKFHGQGNMKYANGNTYDGEWRNGHPNGQGSYSFQSNDRYEGQLKNGLFNGTGTMYYADGSRYEGEWQENKRQGLGTLYHNNGEQINGQWENNQYLADWGRMAYSGDTTSLRNCNTQNCDSGKGKFRYQDGSQYYGDFSQGVPEGIGSVYYFSGDRYEGGWNRHAPHGKGVMYYANGKVVGAIWEHGVPVRQLFTSQQDAPSTVRVERSDEVKIWAVVVGAARYTHMPVLRYTDDDAYQLFAFLKSPEGGALPDHQIQLLIDEDATHQGILNAMRSVFLRADDNDMILFYFSGHGLQGAFLPVDYDGFANRLEHEEIRDLLRQSRAKHKLVLADACHAGSLLAARAPVHIALQEYYDALNASSGGTALLLSSKGEEYSLEDRGLRSGIFSHFLIRGLKGEANTNTDNLITIRELFNFVHQRTRQYTGNVQTPTLTGTFDDNMPVSVIR